jgi:hypothetical protein
MVTTPFEFFIMLEITNYYQLLALHRTIVEAKFNKNIKDTDIYTSPIISELANKIIEQIIEYHQKSGEVFEANNWKNWRYIDSSRLEWDVIVKRIAEINIWNDISENEKLEFISILASPFLLNSENLESLLNLTNNS